MFANIVCNRDVIFVVVDFVCNCDDDESLVVLSECAFVNDIFFIDDGTSLLRLDVLFDAAR